MGLKGKKGIAEGMSKFYGTALGSILLVVSGLVMTLSMLVIPIKFIIITLLSAMAQLPSYTKIIVVSSIILSLVYIIGFVYCICFTDTEE